MSSPGDFSLHVIGQADGFEAMQQKVLAAAGAFDKGAVSVQKFAQTGTGLSTTFSNVNSGLDTLTSGFSNTSGALANFSTQTSSFQQNIGSMSAGIGSLDSSLQTGNQSISEFNSAVSNSQGPLSQFGQGMNSLEADLSGVGTGVAGVEQGLNGLVQGGLTPANTVAQGLTDTFGSKLTGALANAGSQAKTTGSSFTSLFGAVQKNVATISFAVSAITGLIFSYQELQKSQFLVQRAEIALESIHIRVATATKALTAAQLEFGAGSAEAEAAAAKLQLALDRQSLAEQKLTFVEQRHTQELIQFATQLVPTIIGTLAGVVQAWTAVAESEKLAAFFATAWGTATKAALIGTGIGIAIVAIGTAFQFFQSQADAAKASTDKLKPSMASTGDAAASMSDDFTEGTDSMTNDLTAFKDKVPSIFDNIITDTENFGTKMQTTLTNAMKPIPGIPDNVKGQIATHKGQTFEDLQKNTGIGQDQFADPNAPKGQKPEKQLSFLETSSFGETGAKARAEELERTVLTVRQLNDLLYSDLSRTAGGFNQAEANLNLTFAKAASGTLDTVGQYEKALATIDQDVAKAKKVGIEGFMFGPGVEVDAEKVAKLEDLVHKFKAAMDAKDGAQAASLALQIKSLTTTKDANDDLTKALDDQRKHMDDVVLASIGLVDSTTAIGLATSGNVKQLDTWNKILGDTINPMRATNQGLIEHEAAWAAVDKETVVAMKAEQDAAFQLINVTKINDGSTESILRRNQAQIEGKQAAADLLTQSTLQGIANKQEAISLQGVIEQYGLYDKAVSLTLDQQKALVAAYGDSAAALAEVQSAITQSRETTPLKDAVELATKLAEGGKEAKKAWKDFDQSGVPKEIRKQFKDLVNGEMKDMEKASKNLNNIFNEAATIAWKDDLHGKAAKAFVSSFGKNLKALVASDPDAKTFADPIIAFFKSATGPQIQQALQNMTPFMEKFNSLIADGDISASDATVLFNEWNKVLGKTADVASPIPSKLVPIIDKIQLLGDASATTAEKYKAVNDAIEKSGKFHVFLPQDPEDQPIWDKKHKKIIGHTGDIVEPKGQDGKDGKDTVTGGNDLGVKAMQAAEKEHVKFAASLQKFVVQALIVAGNKSAELDTVMTHNFADLNKQINARDSAIIKDLNRVAVEMVILGNTSAELDKVTTKNFADMNKQINGRDSAIIKDLNRVAVEMVIVGDTSAELDKVVTKNFADMNKQINGRDSAMIKDMNRVAAEMVVVGNTSADLDNVMTHNFADMVKHVASSASAFASSMSKIVNAMKAAESSVNSLKSAINGLKDKTVTVHYKQTGTPPGGGGSKPGSHSTGGLFFADSATSATFGEAGDELALFMPLRRPGQPSRGSYDITVPTPTLDVNAIKNMLGDKLGGKGGNVNLGDILGKHFAGGQKVITIVLNQLEKVIMNEHEIMQIVRKRIFKQELNQI